MLNTITKPLLRLGVPMGPDVLLTVRGRRTGLPRSTPVAVAEIAGRHWLVAPFGDSDWVLNLRAAGRGTIGSGRASREITVRELDESERVVFFRDVLEPYVRTQPVVGWIVRTIDQLPPDPVEAARMSLVFEVERGLPSP